MVGFSPKLAELVVWEINRAWLIKAPCFRPLLTECKPLDVQVRQ